RTPPQQQQQQQQQQSKWNVGQHRRGRPTPLHRSKQQRGHREQRKHQQHDQPRLRRPQPSPQQQQQQQRREMEISLENYDDEDDLHGKHTNRTRIPCFWSTTGIWVSHARLLSLVMVLDLMILSVQVRVLCSLNEEHHRAVFEPCDKFLLLLCAPISRDESGGMYNTIAGVARNAPTERRATVVQSSPPNFVCVFR
ncbi:unnamed protein product, partial [Ectocarpus sp. 12 AP-2014]